MVRLLSRVIGVGIETADMLVREILSRKMQDRSACRPLRRYHRFSRRNWQKAPEKGLARANDPPTRHDSNWLGASPHQKESALAQWYRERTAGGRRGTRTP